jgi:hypothetical protein
VIEELPESYNIDFRVGRDIIVLPIPSAVMQPPSMTPLSPYNPIMNRFCIPFVRTAYQCMDLVRHIEQGYSTVYHHAHYPARMQTVLCLLRAKASQICDTVYRFRLSFSWHLDNFSEEKFEAMLGSVHGVDTLIEEGFDIMLRWMPYMADSRNIFRGLDASAR